MTTKVCLERMNTTGGIKDIQLYPSMCLGVRAVEKRTLLGSRSDDMDIFSKIELRNSRAKKFSLQINQIKNRKIILLIESQSLRILGVRGDNLRSTCPTPQQ